MEKLYIIVRKYKYTGDFITISNVPVVTSEKTRVFEYDFEKLSSGLNEIEVNVKQKQI